MPTPALSQRNSEQPGSRWSPYRPQLRSKHLRSELRGRFASRLAATSPDAAPGWRPTPVGASPLNDNGGIVQDAP
jgi:hypothetical protein